MVRGPASLLGVYAAALAYFLLAPALPGLPGGATATLIAGGVGLAVLGACGLVTLQAREHGAGLILLALGAGLLTVALTAGHVGPATDPFRALLAAALGILFARFLDSPVAVALIPPFVAILDALSVAGGPSSQLIRQQPRAVDFLTFDIPAWGGGLTGSQLGLSDVIFLSMFAAWAWRFGLRARVTELALMTALLGALGLSVALDTAVPVLPLLAAALLVPNLDRLAGLLVPGHGHGHGHGRA